MSHTPTPWHVQGHPDDHERDNFMLFGSDGGCVSAWMDAPNAAHIVRCVNSHDALVAALRDVLEGYVSRCNYCHGNEADCCLAPGACRAPAARTALKAAEAE